MSRVSQQGQTSDSKRAGDDDTVRAGAFALLFDRGKPASVADIAACTNLSTTVVEAVAHDLSQQGRLRFDNRQRVVGIAGLSVEPTPHEITVDGVTRWTWCALDAVGILGALGRGGLIRSAVPESKEILEIRFIGSQPTTTETALFLADDANVGSVVDEWCPLVNLFETREDAQRWAADRGLGGRVVSVVDFAADAAALWQSLVAPQGSVAP